MPPLLGGRSFTIGPFYAKPELLIGFAAAVACTIALRFMLQATYLTFCRGKLLLVDNVIDQATATIRLKAMFPNEDEKLWPGEFVNAHVLLDTRGNAVVVPSAAVQRGPQGLFVWTVTAKNLAEPRPIEVGPTYEGLTVVASGLSGGERIVTDGQYKLQRDAPVTVTSPPMAGAGGNS